MIRTGLVKTGLKNEEKISELLISGSAAIKTKNDFGVHIFSGSVVDDGIVSGQLIKPKYNEEELLKSIDTTIIELLEPDAPLNEPTILLSAYEEAISVVDDLTQQVEDLNKIVLDLSAKVQSLEIVSESLRIEMDSKELLLAVAQNQTQQATTKVESSVIDLQTAIQKATAESIQRVSLAARNTSLIQENAVLNEALISAQNQIINLNGTVNNLNSQLNTNQTQLIQANQQLTNATTKKKKIICNELYRQGYLPEYIWDADERYGEMMWDIDRKLVIGYNIWAKGVVDFMRKNPKYTKYVYFFVKPWTEYMAYEVGTLKKTNLIGKVIHFFGKRYSYFVYDKYMAKRNKLVWQ
jgi:uncharacterized phage infection (PIP) family protein YhgE